MQIDRRITNGLAWAGALLVVGVLAGDFIVRSLAPQGEPQLAIVQEQEAEAPTPAPLSQRPAEPEKVPPVASKPAPTPEPEPADEPVRVATPQPTGPGDAVDRFLQSGRELPSYISDGQTTAPARPAPTTAPQTPAQPAAAVPPPATAPAATNPAPEAVATLPPKKVAPIPMPLSMRPPSVASQPSASLIIPEATRTPTRAPAVVTSDDLEDWESGPLDEFLRNRQAGSFRDSEEYDADGFFLDEGPNSSARFQRFPRAYDDGEYFVIR